MKAGVQILFGYLEAIKSLPPKLPEIPSYTILGRIGGGSYGEVFLARTVTGLYRAVKVVRREDFDLEKTFEREFEGIKRYERVSQNHSGLVDVLHVGREPNADFYYYVMELADDESGATIDEIDVAEYRPRTLSSDLRRKPVREIGECVSFGRSLAEALAHLHQAGLTHRDVKPSNIIFVKGEPRLADIGLVARTGQRTFVGTEGYVPPEGPGTASADLYSLAMVLYEMHTGKDRLEFPELPTNHELAPTVNRDEWRNLNGVICRAGAPDPRKRFKNGHEFAEALRKVCPEEFPLSGEPAPDAESSARFNKMVVWSAVLGLVVLTLTALFLCKVIVDSPPVDQVLVENGSGSSPAQLSPAPISTLAASGSPSSEEEDFVSPVGRRGRSPEESEKDAKATRKGLASPSPEKSGPDDPGKTGRIHAVPAELPRRRIKFESVPSGATVWVGGREIGRTPTPYREFEVGNLEFVFRKPGFHVKTVSREIEAGEPTTVRENLLEDSRPVPGEPWSNSGGLRFIPTVGEGDLQARVDADVYEKFLEATNRPVAVVVADGTVQVSDDVTKWAFCDWMTERDRQLGYLDGSQYYAPVPPPEFISSHSLVCRIADEFGTLILNSKPTGAKIFLGTEFVGETPTTLEMRQGLFQLRVSLEGYGEEEVIDALADADPVPLTVPLERDGSVVFGETWENSLGMGLVPVGSMLVAAYETRVLEYSQFLESRRAADGLAPETGFAPGHDHPVVGVSRRDAELFCEWLTEKERREKRIRSWHEYRLPTDLEWSRLAGLTGETGDTPKARDSRDQVHFPWGEAWPPEHGTGNFADVSAQKQLGKYIIAGYNDGFERTSPTGSFAPSALGLFDVAGNVWEWVSDSYDPGDERIGVVRGGGWDSCEKGVLLSSYRNRVEIGERDDYYGFRYVLVKTR